MAIEQKLFDKCVCGHTLVKLGRQEPMLPRDTHTTMWQCIACNTIYKFHYTFNRMEKI